MSPDVKALVRFLLPWSAVAALLLLTLSGFFSAWDARAVSVREIKPDQAVFRVLLVEADRRFEVDWPAAAVDGLDLRIDRQGLPPLPLPDGLPTTHKSRFSLSFTVTEANGAERRIATTSPQGLAVAFLVFAVGVLVRNMMVSGSPLSLAPRPRPADAPPGSSRDVPRAEPTRTRSRKGPPPPHSRPGAGRRR